VTFRVLISTAGSRGGVPLTLLHPPAEGAPVARRRPADLLSWWPLPAVAVVVLLVADLLVAGAVDRADLAVRAAAASVPRGQGAQQAALVADDLGLGLVCGVVLAGAAAAAARHRRSWEPVLLVVGAALLLNAVVGGLKLLLGRGQAVLGDPALFAGGMAFPSGHAANTAFTASLLVHLLRTCGRPVRRASAVVAVLAPSAATAVVSLFLGFHWASDLVAGTLVGALVAWCALRCRPWLARRLPRRRPAPVVLLPLRRAEAQEQDDLREAA